MDSKSNVSKTTWKSQRLLGTLLGRKDFPDQPCPCCLDSGRSHPYRDSSCILRRNGEVGIFERLWPESLKGLGANCQHHCSDIQRKPGSREETSQHIRG